MSAKGWSVWQQYNWWGKSRPYGGVFGLLLALWFPATTVEGMSIAHGRATGIEGIRVHVVHGARLGDVAWSSRYWEELPGPSREDVPVKNGDGKDDAPSLESQADLIVDRQGTQPLPAPILWLIGLIVLVVALGLSVLGFYDLVTGRFWFAVLFFVGMVFCVLVFALIITHTSPSALLANDAANRGVEELPRQPTEVIR